MYKCIKKEYSIKNFRFETSIDEEAKNEEQLKAFPKDMIMIRRNCGKKNSNQKRSD